MKILETTIDGAIFEACIWFSQLSEEYVVTVTSRPPFGNRHLEWESPRGYDSTANAQRALKRHYPGKEWTEK